MRVLNVDNEMARSRDEEYVTDYAHPTTKEKFYMNTYDLHQVMDEFYTLKRAETVHDDIAKKEKLHKKPMSQSQLRAILKIVAVYDVKLPSLSHLNTIQASEKIQQLLAAVKDKRIVKRAKLYKWEDLEQAFMDKYPEAFANIMNRDL